MWYGACKSRTTRAAVTIPPAKCVSACAVYTAGCRKTRYITNGGGGYGNPHERPVEKVVWDVRNGLVSIEGAKKDYGVVIADPETLEVDTAATARLRVNER